MKSVARLSALIVSALAPLLATSLPVSLVGNASAATGQITATGSWVYPGKLKITTSGTPTMAASATHSTDWWVFALPPSTACPTAFDDSLSDAIAAEGTPDGTTFTQTDFPENDEGGQLFPDTKDYHLCGLMTETDSSTGPDGQPNPTTSTVTGTSDTPLAAHEPHYVVVGGWGQEYRKVRVHVRCGDLWPNSKLALLRACDLQGTMKMTISAKGMRKLGLASTSIGHATFAFDPNTAGYYSYLTTSKAVAKALPKWNNARYAGKMVVTVTSPIQMTRTATIYSPFDLYGFDSSKTGFIKGAG